MKPVQFVLGQMVELTSEEQNDLYVCSNRMIVAATEQDPGWFRIYLEQHRKAHRVITGIFKRNHATEELEHGSGH